MEKIIFNFYLILLLFTLTSSQDDIIFSKESGFYTEEFLLVLSTSSKTLKIFYTTDRSDPTNSTTTTEYKELIPIIERSQNPIIYGNYEEDMDFSLSISFNCKYKKPPFPLDKVMIIRAVSKNGGNYEILFLKNILL